VIEPTTAPPQLEVLEGGTGLVLAAERRRQGLSIEQVAAATRIRPVQLLAIERDDLAALPGPIYARIYVRSYSAHLGLDPEPLMQRQAAPEPPARASGPFLSLARLAPRLPAGLVLTAPVVTAFGLLLVLALFSTYALYELRSARLDGAPSAGPAAAAAPPIASAAPLPSALPTAVPAPAPVSVGIRATELVWVQVTVDGKAVYGTAGRMMQPGAADTFSGRKVKIQAGKPSLLVSVGGSGYTPLGVLTKEYSAQT